MSYSSKNIAEKIKAILKQKKISATTMLKECNLNKNTLYTMNTEGYMPRLETIIQISDYLDCSIDYLLNRTKKDILNQERYNKNTDNNHLLEMILARCKNMNTEGLEYILSQVDYALLQDKYKKYNYDEETQMA